MSNDQSDYTFFHVNFEVCINILVKQWLVFYFWVNDDPTSITIQNITRIKEEQTNYDNGEVYTSCSATYVEHS